MYRIQLIFTIILFKASINAGHLFTKLHPDTGLLPEQLIKKYGYPFEQHTVQTSDGYLLTLHRIPYGIKNNNTEIKRPVALIMHGYLSTSADFIITGPDRAISFLLADAGYDVWLGNNRGNTFSRKHISIDPDKENTKFFNFSCDELGLFDLPAKIDYILNKTKQKQLFYVGHSVGATAILMLLSTKTEYNDKIRMVTTLAPIVYLNNAPSLFVKVFNIIYIFYRKIANIQISFEVLPNDTFLQPLLKIIATVPGVRELLIFVQFLTDGFDSVELDREFLPVILTNFPGGSSFNQAAHFLQIRDSKKFIHYDYGHKGNLEKYGQIEPPIYNLSKITAPMSIYYSLNDYFVSLQDLNKLVKEMPTVTLKRVALSSFNHIDYMWSIDIAELLNNRVVNDIKSFS